MPLNNYVVRRRGGKPVKVEANYFVVTDAGNLCFRISEGGGSYPLSVWTFAVGEWTDVKLVPPEGDE